MKPINTLYVVVPCYNEEEVLTETTNQLVIRLKALMESGRCNEHSRILYVDDGSRDKTWEIITQLHKLNPLILGLKLAHNRGHQNALLAGLMTAKESADCVISMDADLQDDIDVLDDFMDKYLKEGCEIVYGVRSKRDTDSYFKRTSAECFYKIMHLLGVEVVFNHADYRLMSRRALDALGDYREVNLFLRGIVPLIGLKQDTVAYNRQERFAGESKYPLKKMIAFALDGITSFSVKPIRIIFNVGIFISILSVIALIWVFIAKLTGSAVSGWSATVASVWLLGGINMFCLGVIGEYIGKIYSETKARPKYLIETYLNDVSK